MIKTCIKLYKVKKQDKCNCCLKGSEGPSISMKSYTLSLRHSTDGSNSCICGSFSSIG